MNKTDFDFSVSVGAVAKFGMKEKDYDRIDDKQQIKKILVTQQLKLCELNSNIFEEP